MILAIGLVAAALTIISFFAQVRKILKTRDTKGLSKVMWMLSTSSFAVWVAYGVLLRQWPIVVPNAVCCVLAAFILALQVMPRHRREQVAAALAPGAPPPTSRKHHVPAGGPVRSTSETT